MTESKEELGRAAKPPKERKYVVLILVLVALMVLIPAALVIWLAVLLSRI